MKTTLMEFLLKRKRIVIMTFQVFWIIVFLLERLGQSSGSEVPQFIYTNF